MAHNLSGRNVGDGQVGLRGVVSHDLLDQQYGGQHDRGEVAIEQHPFQNRLTSLLVRKPGYKFYSIGLLTWQFIFCG